MHTMKHSAMPPSCSRASAPVAPATALATLAFVLFLIAGCASRQQSADSVEARAQARWDALLSNDLDTAYGYYSPGYRSSHSRVDFEVALRMRRIAWTSAKVEESRCAEDACTVVTRVGYRVGAPVPGVPKWESERRIEERWVHIQNAWWFVPEE